MKQRHIRFWKAIGLTVLVGLLPIVLFLVVFLFPVLAGIGIHMGIKRYLEYLMGEVYEDEIWVISVVTAVLLCYFSFALLGEYIFHSWVMAWNLTIESYQYVFQLIGLL